MPAPAGHRGVGFRQPLPERVVRGRIVQLPRDVVKVGREPVPALLVEAGAAGRREGPERVTHLRLEGAVIHLTARHRDDGELLGQESVSHEMKE